ncbi:MAG: hypothetical protein P1U53_08925 [Sulfitobacter sp.]|nr:hypothetical protein [Sulfitobacter sp.]
MIGVVLWSDPAKGQAVFWCEDHGDLAYFSVGQDLSCAENAFTPGDMVEFDMTGRAEYREAQRPRLVRQQECLGLQRGLRAAARRERLGQRPQGTAEIITLHANELPSPALRQQEAR